MQLWKNKIASHILVFLTKSIMNPLPYAFATFATDSIRSFQLFPLFWRSVAILEITCKLKVIAAMSDGASPNRSFYKMHNALSNNISDITYKACNLFSSDNRDLWFFSGPPHLIKTVKNSAIQLHTNVHDTCGIMGWTFYGLMLFKCTMRILKTTYATFLN